jgi:hypothetical protein
MRIINKILVISLILITFYLMYFAYNINKKLIITNEELVISKQKQNILIEELNTFKKEEENDEYEQIKADLIKHTELIPYKGTLGGKMEFYSKSDMHVFGNRWVVADFEDGHNGGSIVLKYAESTKGKIKWKVLDAYLD